MSNEEKKKISKLLATFKSNDFKDYKNLSFNEIIIEKKSDLNLKTLKSIIQKIKF